MSSNRLDTKMLAIRVADEVAGAEINTLEAWSYQLAILVAHDELTKQQAIDTLHFAALGSGVYARFGADEVQGAIGVGFQELAQ
jgi:hypothetical protein